MSLSDACLHFSVAQPGACRIGRRVPLDCGVGCAAYVADLVGAMSLDREEQTRQEIWARVTLARPVPAWPVGKPRGKGAA
jgi:hypothetical protein